MQVNFRELELVVAISWQLRGLHGFQGMVRGCYGVSHGNLPVSDTHDPVNNHIDPVITTR